MPSKVNYTEETNKSEQGHFASRRKRNVNFQPIDLPNDITQRDVPWSLIYSDTEPSQRFCQVGHVGSDAYYEANLLHEMSESDSQECRLTRCPNIAGYVNGHTVIMIFKDVVNEELLGRKRINGSPTGGTPRYIHYMGNSIEEGPSYTVKTRRGLYIDPGSHQLKTLNSNACGVSFSSPESSRFQIINGNIHVLQQTYPNKAVCSDLLIKDETLFRMYSQDPMTSISSAMWTGTPLNLSADKIFRFRGLIFCDEAISISQHAQSRLLSQALIDKGVTISKLCTGTGLDRTRPIETSMEPNDQESKQVYFSQMSGESAILIASAEKVQSMSDILSSQTSFFANTRLYNRLIQDTRSAKYLYCDIDTIKEIEPGVLYKMTVGSECDLIHYRGCGLSTDVPVYGMYPDDFDLPGFKPFDNVETRIGTIFDPDKFNLKQDSYKYIAQLYGNKKVKKRDVPNYNDMNINTIESVLENTTQSTETYGNTTGGHNATDVFETSAAIKHYGFLSDAQKVLFSTFSSGFARVTEWPVHLYHAAINNTLLSNSANVQPGHQVETHQLVSLNKTGMTLT